MYITSVFHYSALKKIILNIQLWLLQYMPKCLRGWVLMLAINSEMHQKIKRLDRVITQMDGLTDR